MEATISYRVRVPLRELEYGVYGDLIMVYPKPYSIYVRGDYRCWVAIKELKARYYTKETLLSSIYQ